MLYNIWLEVAALGFIVLIWIFYKLQYQSKNDINQRFETLTCMIFFLTATDVASAIAISYCKLIPAWISYVLNGGNFVFAGISAYSFVSYIRTLLGQQNTMFAKLEKGATVVYVLLEAINPCFGFFFSFDETGYVHGPFYLFQLLFAYAFVVITAILLVLYHKRLNVRKIIGTGGYVLMMLIAAAMQIAVIPNFLLTGFVSTIVLFVMFFLMETPDYYRLLETMDELEKAKVEANKANDAKSKFLANMSHEIRTPLNTVLGMDEMILREEKDPEIIEYARNIKSSGNTLLGIINDILDFSKIESGMLTISPYEYNIANTVANANTMFRMKAEDRGLSFYTELDTKLPRTLFGDEMRISQIIINLVNNAIKYTEKGKVEVFIKGKPAENDDTITLSISVKDSGIGIKERDMVRLFAEFERLDLEKNRNIEGTGLGLAIVSRLTHAMGGTINVESTYGEGSTFTVEIPQIIVDAKPIGEVNVSSENNNSKYYERKFVAPEAKILAVDDNRVNLVVLTKLLKLTEVKVTTATSGVAALALMEKEDFDIVLLDHMMPEMDGIETLHAAREIDTNKGHRPVYIALTANAIQGADKMYKDEGFDAYLTKPIDASKLEETLMKYLDI